MYEKNYLVCFQRKYLMSNFDKINAFVDNVKFKDNEPILSLFEDEYKKVEKECNSYSERINDDEALNCIYLRDLEYLRERFERGSWRCEMNSELQIKRDNHIKKLYKHYFNN